VCSSAAAARDADAGARDLALLRCDPVSPYSFLAHSLGNVGLYWICPDA
jgi:hypothetical protein